MVDKHDDDALEGLFAQAREDGPSPDLMARVLADAEAVRTTKAQALTAPKASLARRIWLRLLGSVGGWGALSGILSAGVAGLTIGLFSPDAVVGFLANEALTFGIGASDFSPDVGGLWTEGGDV